MGALRAASDGSEFGLPKPFQMNSHPLIGLAYHWVGGLASASFYVPYRKIRKWSWETYWLAGGIFSWLIAPVVLASILTHGLFHVILEAPIGALFWSLAFGLLWGLGGLTFGLTVRYLGMSLGYNMALGICAICGTLIPPFFRGQLTAIAATSGGRVTLLGIGICLVGIVLSAFSGLSKERELPAEQKAASVKEFNFNKGLLVAAFCGMLSSCFAFGLDAASPLAELSLARGTPAIWSGLPKLVSVLLGGLISNGGWCIVLHQRRGSGREYFQTIDAGGEAVPSLLNWIICAAAGVTWYLQFFFYTMGETQMGRFGFSSWTLHMASIIIFSTIWGLALKEWKGTSGRTRALLFAGLAVLILSTVVVGFGNYLHSLT